MTEEAAGRDPREDEPTSTGRPMDTPLELSRREAVRGILVRKTNRRERARSQSGQSVVSWLGTFGLVGWTVSIPTLLGLALGAFLDARFDRSVSFTVTFLVVGAAVGSATAWYWIRRESEDDVSPR